MGDLVRPAGDRSDVETFVETLLPPGTSGIVVRGVEYVAEVRVVADLPAWANAMRVRDIAFVRPADAHAKP